MENTIYGLFKAVVSKQPNAPAIVKDYVKL